VTVTEAPPRRTNRHAQPPRLPTERRRGALGGVAVGQIVAAEAAVVAVLAVLGGPVLLQVVVGVIALILLALVFGRRDGQWWYESLWLRREFRARIRRAAAVRATADPIATAVARIRPELTVSSVPDRRGRFGVGQDDCGFFVALEAMPSQNLDGQRSGSFQLGQFGELLTSATVPVSALQVVIHVVPAPSGVLDWQAPCVASYYELIGNSFVPNEQRVWLAARLSPSDAREAAEERGGGVAGVHRALAAVVGRLDKALRTSGTPVRALDADELIAAVATVTGVADAATDGTITAKEEWWGWRTAEAVHVCLRLSHLPQRPLPEFISQLSRQHLMSFTLSIELVPASDGSISVAGLLRVSAPPGSIDEVVRRATTLCHRLGVVAQRLDGRHAPAVYTVAPTGGGAS
jgi:type VII secretion protein EccE